MSLIMTVDGWKQLSPTCENRIYRRVSYDHRSKDYIPDDHGEFRHVATAEGLPTPAMERGGYTGAFPSRDVCDFINSMKDKMIHFDDGKRMKYTKYASRPQFTPRELNQLAAG